MKSLLDKLDRKAGRWLATLDSEFQQPVVQVMTGAVFTNGTPSNHHRRQEEQTMEQAAQPVNDPIGCEDMSAPLLRKANALDKC